MDHYLFTSTLFNIEPGEDEDTQPGIYGRQLAVWLKAQLEGHGYSVEPVIAEDWGYCLICSRTPFLLWVGCGNMEDGLKEVEPSRIVWHCFAVAEVPFWKGFFKKPDTRLALTQLDSDLHAILLAYTEIALVGESYPAARTEITQATGTANIRTIAWKWLTSVCAMPLGVFITRLNGSGAGLLLTLIGFIATLLYTFDLVPALSGATGWCARIARLVLGTVQFLFGLLAACIGLSIILWILYNLLIERQPEYTDSGSYALILLIFIGGLRWLAGAWTWLRRKHPPKGSA